eukprot:gene8382-10297_t
MISNQFKILTCKGVKSSLVGSGGVNTIRFYQKNHFNHKTINNKNRSIFTFSPKSSSSTSPFIINTISNNNNNYNSFISNRFYSTTPSSPSTGSSNINFETQQIPSSINDKLINIEDIHNTSNISTQSLLSTPTTATPPVTELSDNAIVAFFQELNNQIVNGLVDINQNYGIPYVGLIIGLTIASRILTFPIVLKTQRLSSTMMEVKEEVEKFTHLNDGTNEGRVKMFQKQQEINRQFGISPFSMIGWAMLQSPFLIVPFFIVKNLTETPYLMQGGALWFTNLSIPDPYFIIPVVSSLIQMGTATVNFNSSTNLILKIIMYGLCVIPLFFTLKFSAGLNIYWCTSSALFFVTAVFFKRPSVRKFFGLKIFDQVVAGKPTNNVQFAPKRSFDIVKEKSKLLELKKSELESLRIDKTINSEYIQLGWPGIEIYFSITGTTTLEAVLSSPQGQSWYNVLINSAFFNPLQVNSTSPTNFDLTNNSMLDPNQTYTVVLTRRTEAAVGIGNFYGFLADQDSVITPFPNIPTRKLEVIGDSISCGYGDLGVPPCPFEPETEDNYLSYGSIISRQLNAQLYVEAWSGKGVVRNYGSNTTTSTDTLPDLYERTIPTNQTSAWEFQDYQPDAVVINLGTNDFSTQPSPSPDTFEGGYQNFISTIKSKYPSNPTIFLICGPMIGQPCCTYVKNVASATDAIYIDIENILTPTDYGCNSHPNVSGHQKMSSIIAPIIQKYMGWS